MIDALRFQIALWRLEAPVFQALLSNNAVYKFLVSVACILFAEDAERLPPRAVNMWGRTFTIAMTSWDCEDGGELKSTPFLSRRRECQASPTRARTPG